jgi:hypothetical protein
MVVVVFRLRRASLAHLMPIPIQIQCPSLPLTITQLQIRCSIKPREFGYVVDESNGDTRVSENGVINTMKVYHEVGGGYMVLEIRVDNWEKKEDRGE